MRWVRKKAGWIAGVVVGGFLLWLITEAAVLQATQETAGILFGKRVPLSLLAQAREAVLHQTILIHGDRYRQVASDETLTTQAWDRLMTLWEARRKRIRVSDRKVVEELKSWPIFQENGRFSPEAYQAVVQYSLGTTPRIFEEEIRQSLAIDKLIQDVLTGISVTEEELKEEFHRMEEAIRITFLLVPQEKLAQEIAHVARQDPSGLEGIARQLDQKLAPTDFFKRGTFVSELGIAGEFLDRAFRLELGEVAGPFSTPQGWMVARLKEKQPADEEKFQKEKPQLEPQVLAQKRMKTYLAWMGQLRQRANLKKALPKPQAPAPKKSDTP